jgi:hypothetical protein
MVGHGAEPANQNAKKLDTPELRAEAYAQYCAHIAGGFPKKAWCFKHPDVTLTWETMEKYIRESPVDFDPDQKKEAESKSLMKWFGILGGAAEGTNQKANIAALQIILRNMFKWDRPELNQEESSGSLLQTHDLLMAQLTRKQAEADQATPSNESL